MLKGISDGKVSQVFWCGGGKLASSFVTCAQNVFTLLDKEHSKGSGFVSPVWR